MYAFPDRPTYGREFIGQNVGIWVGKSGFFGKGRKDLHAIVSKYGKLISIMKLLSLFILLLFYLFAL